MLLNMDGFTLAAEIRQINESTPILFLTARSSLDDVLQGFRIGADDYLRKPFNLPELLARVKSLLKKNITTSEGEKPIFFAGYCFDRNGQYTYLLK